MSDSRRNEWLRLTTELAALDREAFRRFRAEAWERVAAAHAEKSPEQLETWIASAS